MNKTPKQIVKIVSDYYGVNIFKKSREQTIVKARQMVTYIIVPMFKLINNEAVKYLPNKERSAIPYNLKTFSNRLLYDKELQKELQDVMDIINGDNRVDLFLKSLTKKELKYLKKNLL